MKTTLLIMAAGIGSRFGEGIKQLEPVDRENDINKYSELKDFGMVEMLELPYICENT